MPQPEAPAQVASLPPLDARLISKGERFETPLDERGLVDVPALIELANATVDPMYEWPPKPNVHHFYWPENDYPQNGVKDMGGTYKSFRELPIHMAAMPKVMHAWIHRITLPPPVPEPEVISYRLEAWRVAESLFERAIRQTNRIERQAAQRRRDYLDQNPELEQEFVGQSRVAREIMLRMLEQNFPEEDVKVGRLRAILSQLRVVERPDDKKELVRGLSRIITNKHLEIAT